MAATGAFLYSPCSPAYAQGATVTPGSTASADEIQLFNLINAARKDPLGVADSLGMDRNKILNDFPELSQILTQGLPELVFSDRLYQTAGDHCRDMLKNNYYSYDSIDGRTPSDRMNDAGYVAAVSGESLGLLFFNNFISSGQAVSQIFANIYKDELNPQWTGQRNILNPDVNDLGVAMVGGLYGFDGNSGNVYLVTCDFGAEIAPYNLEMIQMVNQARDNPSAVAKFYGMNVNDILKNFPNLKPLFSTGVPPVAVNAQLYAAASGHAADMMGNGYDSLVSPDGSTPDMRIRQTGYEPVWTAETLIRIATCNNEVSPQLTVSRIFKQMLNKAFRTDNYRDQNMFSDQAADAGISMIAGESAALGSLCGDFLQLTVADYGARTIGPDFATTIIGVVYEDANGNGMFDSGEGASGLSVTINMAGVPGSLQKIYTNPVGGFSKTLAPGRYRVVINAPGEKIIKWIDLNTANVWVPVEIGNAGTS